MRSRSRILVAVGAFSVAWGGLFFTGVGQLPVEASDTPAASKAAKEGVKAEHPNAVAMRNRLLTEFHGRATDTFTSIPGFGFARMRPLYERISWETPHFSTNDVEVETSPETPKLLKQVFAKSLESFAKPAPIAEGGTSLMGRGRVLGRPGFGMVSNERMIGLAPDPALGDVISEGLQLRLLDLVGLMDAGGPKVYSGGKAFELIRSTRPRGVGPATAEKSNEAKETPRNQAEKEIPALETRPLDLFETAGVIELRAGQETFVRTKDNVVRMLGALRASEQCLKCHTESRKGDLLGAFSYSFVDTNGTLKKDSAKESR